MLKKSVCLLFMMLLFSCTSNTKKNSNYHCSSTPEVQLNQALSIIEKQYIFNAPFKELTAKILQTYTKKYTDCRSEIDGKGNIKIFNNDSEKVFLLEGIDQFLFVNQLIQSQPFFISVTDPQYLLNNITVTDLLLNSIALSLKNTEYYSNNDINKFNSNLSVKQASIGINIIKENSFTIISTVYYGGPAYQSGLKSGNIIYKINDKEIKDLSLLETADLIKGKKGTIVKISVKNNNAIKDFEIYRDFTEDRFNAKMIENNILYVQIPYLTKDIKNEIIKYDSKVSGIVFDIRGCPGGDMYDVVSLCGLFVPQKEVIVFLKRKNSGDRAYVSTDEKQFKKIPIVILIDSSTSSGAELFARCLKYYNNAGIIGDKSFGTGTIYSFFDLCNNTYLKMPMAEMLAPDKKSVSSKLTPDVFTDEKSILQEAVNYVLKQKQ